MSSTTSSVNVLKHFSMNWPNDMRAAAEVDFARGAGERFNAFR